MTENNILTPLSEDWDDFTSALIRHLNATEKHDEYGDFDYIDFNCDGSFKVCRNLLENRYPEIDIEATISYFKANKWFCDCEVFNECPCGLGKNKVEKLKIEGV